MVFIGGVIIGFIFGVIIGFRISTGQAWENGYIAGLADGRNNH